MCFGVASLRGNPHDFLSLAPSFIADVGGLFLLVGLWTPVMGTLVALDEVWIVLSLSPRWREDAWVQILLATLAVGVAMLGPGAWSIDARLFGRKRFDIGRGNRSSLH
jgi:putative oxidoreductase